MVCKSIKMSQSQQSNTPNTIQRVPQTHSGRCKWFSNRLGYGFITIDTREEGSSTPEDVFIHQTNVHPSSSTFRTLYQGEYLSFALSSTDGSWQAVSVTGINGGPLLCDAQRRRDGESRDGGASRDGESRGGESRGGAPRGGESRGGAPRGGAPRGGASRDGGGRGDRNPEGRWVWQTAGRGGRRRRAVPITKAPTTPTPEPTVAQ